MNLYPDAYKLSEVKIMPKYIKELEEAEIVQTRHGEHGTVHIAVNDLASGEENERIKESVNKLVFDILYRQAQKEAREKHS